MIHIGSAHVTSAQNKCKCEKGPGTQQVPLNSHVHLIPLYHGTGGTVSMGQVRGPGRIVGQAWSVRVGCPVDVDVHWTGRTIPSGKLNRT